MSSRNGQIQGYTGFFPIIEETRSQSHAEELRGLLAALPTGDAWVAAFQSNTHYLYIDESNGDLVDTGLPMEAGTSPAAPATTPQIAAPAACAPNKTIW